LYLCCGHHPKKPGVQLTVQLTVTHH